MGSKDPNLGLYACTVSSLSTKSPSFLSLPLLLCLHLRPSSLLPILSCCLPHTILPPSPSLLSTPAYLISFLPHFHLSPTSPHLFHLFLLFLLTLSSPTFLFPLLFSLTPSSLPVFSLLLFVFQFPHSSIFLHHRFIDILKIKVPLFLPLSLSPSPCSLPPSFQLPLSPLLSLHTALLYRSPQLPGEFISAAIRDQHLP